MQETQEMQVRSLSQEDPLQKKMATTPVFLPGKSHGEKSLVGYGPVGCKASDTTEQLNTNTVIVVFNSGTVCGGVHTHKKVGCGLWWLSILTDPCFTAWEPKITNMCCLVV